METKDKILLGGFLVLFGVLAGVLGVFATGPSAFCHVTDGAFTSCNDGNTEWSDIQATSFSDVSGLLSVLYVDQADLDPLRGVSAQVPVDTLMLMYDEVRRITPLGVGEAVHIHFMTVDNLKLLHYDVFIGTGGIQKVLINNVEQIPMPSGVAGIAGFGASPNSNIPHVIAEFQIGLEAAGFTPEECCYSPDPAWWGSDVPSDPRCPPDDGTRQGDVISSQQQGQCLPGEPVSTSAAVLTANLDGTTDIKPQPLLPPDEEPSLCESIGRIVDFRVPPTGAYKNHGDYVRQVAQLTEALVNSQIEAGLITQEEAEKLQSCVVNPRARSEVGKN